MKKSFLFFLTLLIFNTLYAQWRYQTIDNGFDDPYKVALVTTAKEDAVIRLELILPSYSESGQMTLLLITPDRHWDYPSYVSADLSFKLDNSWKKYHSYSDFKVIFDTIYSKMFRYDCYTIKNIKNDGFWKDFKRATSMKIRLLNKEILYPNDDDYKYYEFGMSGSAKAFDFIHIDMPQDTRPWSERIKSQHTLTRTGTFLSPDGITQTNFRLYDDDTVEISPYFEEFDALNGLNLDYEFEYIPNPLIEFSGFVSKPYYEYDDFYEDEDYDYKWQYLNLDVIDSVYFEITSLFKENPDTYIHHITQVYDEKSSKWITLNHLKYEVESVDITSDDSKEWIWCNDASGCSPNWGFFEPLGFEGKTVVCSDCDIKYHYKVKQNNQATKQSYTKQDIKQDKNCPYVSIYFDRYFNDWRIYFPCEEDGIEYNGRTYYKRYWTDWRTIR